ncbi:MbcA/ParS/Xre antitoxin family protein [Novosphingobium sp. JCM 18896]|uniref:MbcA/ParS/Xre antitoxin family protein n=1 Tax=Novosphingobium sp. JCM 18896 TaxID=2989731 RepID=UPI0022231467|nr:MbcA/ParS/Xre antitoxin family protein [Novosphingobium sp. JCM 18896]MCW1431734.1 MbcA/ParS/Xre antitoxin family protein [Novosphingobium sp. JCM 18896]
MAEAVVTRKSPSAKPGQAFDFRAVYSAMPADRIAFIKSGVSARKAKLLFNRFQLDQKVMLDALGLKTATVNRKAVNDETLAIDEGERVIGLVKLVGQVQAMVEEAGDPEGFDAAEWLSDWLRRPLPAFGGVKPIAYLDTMEGQALISRTLGQMLAGVYA